MIAPSKSLPEGPLVAWLGDDFTGSAAVMEVLSFAGLLSVLFLDIPTPAQLEKFGNLRGIGIASTARSHGPDWMELHLPPVFKWLAERRAAITHYKVCSTLDSAPDMGSIGKAIDLAAEFRDGWIPCMVAAPAIRRYQAFGHLFAGGAEGVFRLDRHPVMARHPVTPMLESDVVRHLSRQTVRRFGLIDLEAISEDADALLASERAGGAEIICLDAVSAKDVERVGRLIWEKRGDGIFAVGSQGIEYALVAHWRAAGLLPPAAEPVSAGPVERLIVVSGSVSPVTAAQIDWAEAHGFALIRLNTDSVVRGDRTAEVAAQDAALQALSEGRDPLILTARGPDDPAVLVYRNAVADTGIGEEAANARIGTALGRILAYLVQTTGLRRAVISGGDTSGHASRQLDIFAYSALASTIPGAAMLQAHSDSKVFDGLQLALKGGQMGSPDYFGWIKRGGGAAPQGDGR